MNTLSAIKEEEFENIDYFEVETNSIINKLVNDFIKKAIPNLYPHYADNDENDGQKLRVQLTKLLSLQKQELREKVRNLKHSKYLCGNCDTNKLLDKVLDLLK